MPVIFPFHLNLLIMRRLVFVLALLTALVIHPEAKAQRDEVVDSVENLIIYSNEKYGHILAHSHGIGLGYRTGKNVNSFRTRLWTFEAVTLRSGKEVKILNPYWQNAKRYVYGKLNDVILLRAGYSNQYLLNRKPYWGGVELHWLYEAGLSTAVKKPYYLFVLKIVNASSSGITYEIVPSRFDDSSQSTEDIYGRAPFTKGLNEIQLVPGAYAKLGLNFEFGNVRKATNAAEIGVVLDFFPQTVNIMADSQDRIFFLNFYIAYAFGKRFNKY